jgi:hypothetical protein
VLIIPTDIQIATNDCELSGFPADEGIEAQTRFPRQQYSMGHVLGMFLFIFFG